MQYRKVNTATENCLAICGSFRFIHTNLYFMQRQTNDASATNGLTSWAMQNFQTKNSDNVCTTHWNSQHPSPHIFTVPSYSMGTGFFPEEKAAGAEVKPSPPSNSEFKNEYSYTSTPHTPSWRGQRKRQLLLTIIQCLRNFWGKSRRPLTRTTPFNSDQHFKTGTYPRYKISVPVSQYTACISFVNTGRLVPYREIIAVEREDHSEHINSL
jgi:hypothetical protein